MNFLKSISASGLKSGDFRHELDRVNLFVGKSASGKTSRLDAIRLALCGGTILGRASELKTRTIDIMDLARNGHVEVLAVDNQGRTNERRWVRGKNCQIIRQDIPESPQVLLDSSLYTSLSEAKKIEYAFSLFKMDGSEFTHGAIIAELKNIRLDENNATTESILNDILAAAGSGRTLINQSIQDWLSNLLERLKRRLLDAEAEARRMTATVQGITQLSSTSIVRNPEAELKAERARATKILGEKQSLEQQLSDLRSIIQRRRVIQEEILALRDNPEEAQFLVAHIADLETQIQDLERSELSIPTDARIDENAVNAELRKLNHSITEYRSPYRQTLEALSTGERLVQELKFKLQTMLNDRKARVESFNAAMAKAWCPHCGAAPEHWAGDHSRESMTKAHADWLAMQENAIVELTDTLERADKAAQEASGLHKASVLADSIQEDHRRREMELSAKLTLFHTAQNKARMERDSILAGKRSHLERSRRQLETLSMVGAKRKEAEARLMELSIEGKPTEPELLTAIAQKENEVSDIRVKISALEIDQRNFIQSQSDERRNAQALVEHGRAKVNVEVTKAAVAKLEKIQADMVSRAFESILKTVNAITDGIVDAPIEYRAGQIGRWNGATFIPHESFSGTEKALTYAGISLALAKEAPVKIMMIDELGRLDPQSLGRFIARMVALVDDGVCGQFVGCYSGTLLMEGVNIIAL